MKKISWMRIICAVMALALLAGCSKRVNNVSVHSEPTFDDQTDHVLEHEIVSGESLSQIADNYYGDPNRVVGIAAANGITDPNKVLPGSILKLKFTNDEWATASKRATALVAYNKGVDFFAKERLAEAEKQFSLALNTAPDLASAKYNLALVHLKRGKYAKGLTILEGLTELRPANKDFRFARGHALFQLTRFSEAANQFKILTDAHPDHKRGIFSLARSLQEAGKISSAKKAWKRYLELDNTSGWAKTARQNLKKLG